jgi:hypothetical protein
VKGYFDKSEGLDDAGDRWLTLAGFGTSDAVWSTFHDKWRRVLWERISGKTRGGAPTLVPHEKGSTVAAEILVLDNSVDVSEARNILWRRERRKIGSGEEYKEGKSAESVLVGTLEDSPWVETLLYTDFLPAGKITEPTAATLVS